ncbi:ABC-type transport system permease protein (probable substrate sugar) [Halobacterium hubeiense]|uniref:ABC-type transport system permease protein (Probable substrate sugar) n=1 Tax=Halobacterium hubeiense TaxID=1407499 RepID=A0A0U5H507_9EURY|nr:carbohydrate ABC transporter permease [Halobacterium hubeiense]CQH56166.1 ABC-type transport system permease protein (probable substrate sugar) [Halobacterium hubeiense]
MSRDPRRVGLYAVLVALVAFYLMPLEIGLVTSLKSDALASAPFLPPTPEGFTLGEWATAFSALKDGLVNSVLLAVPATVLSALLGSMAAYGLTTLDWRGQVGIFALFLAGIFIPYQAVLIPLSKFWSVYLPLDEILWPLWQLPYLGSHHGDLLALIISHAAYGVPICTLLFRTYYRDISTEMVEAARLDGATAYTIYRRIILPLSVPMFAVTLIYQFTQVWNDLLFALVIMGPGEGAPVTVGLTNLGSSLTDVGFAVKMAGAFIAALPTIIVYVIFGDQFAKGVAT